MLNQCSVCLDGITVVQLPDKNYVTRYTVEGREIELQIVSEEGGYVIGYSKPIRNGEHKDRWLVSVNSVLEGLSQVKTLSRFVFKSLAQKETTKKTVTPSSTVPLDEFRRGAHKWV